MEMFETTIQFKPREQWRAGHDAGQAGRGTRPHGARCRDCPTSGCRRSATASTCSPPASRARSASRSPGPDLAEIDRVDRSRSSARSRTVPGVTSALAERLTGGRYIDVDIDRAAAARYGLNIADVQSIVSARDRRREHRRDGRGPAALPDQRALSARDARLGRERCAICRSLTERGAQIRLGDVAAIRIADGPPMLKSENARLSGWVYVDIRGRDLRSAVRDMQRGGRAATSSCPPATRSPGRVSSSISSGPRRRLEARRAGDAAHHLRAALPDVPPRRRGAARSWSTLPFALVGGFWLL